MRTPEATTLGPARVPSPRLSKTTSSGQSSWGQRLRVIHSTCLVRD